MKKLVVVFWILGSFVSAGFAEINERELPQEFNSCLQNNDADACQVIIDNILKHIKRCDKETCFLMGSIYLNAGYTQEALTYLRNAVIFGDYYAAHFLSMLYDRGGNFAVSLEYEKMVCEKIDISQYKKLKGEACYNVGTMYDNGRGTRTNYFLAFTYFKKACDFGIANGCYNVGQLYGTGDGVRQDFAISKEYIGKSCDLGLQIGCDLYKKLNEAGVQ